MRTVHTPVRDLEMTNKLIDGWPGYNLRLAGRGLGYKLRLACSGRVSERMFSAAFGGVDPCGGGVWLLNRRGAMCTTTGDQ